jgi:hypothetical protein
LECPSLFKTGEERAQKDLACIKLKIKRFRVLILMWFAGDMFKFIYYTSNGDPWQLVLCASF